MKKKNNQQKLYTLLIGLLFSVFILASITIGYLLFVRDHIDDGSSQMTSSAAPEQTQASVLPSDLPPAETASESETPTEEAPKEYDISLMALGDNLMHMAVVKSGLQADGSYDYACLFEGIRDFMDASDLKVINQETILGGNDLGFSGYPKFNSPTEVGDSLAAAGFNVVLHASNHAIDKEVSGLIHCADFWAENHPEVLVTGIHSTTEPYDVPVLTIEGVRFAILNYTYGPNLGSIPQSLQGHLDILCSYNEKTGALDYATLNPKVLEDIRAAREAADFVIVFPHWGTEYHTSPSATQKKFAAQMAEAGADLIIGTHPHVPQPVEWITADNGNRALCYYSLGNYVSTQKKTICMLEEMAWVTIHVKENDITISDHNTGVIPLVCHYKKGSLRIEQVYLLEDYTEELAARHGIKEWGGVTLTLDELQSSAGEIFGDWILKRSDVLD